jgi:tetratricopeptide (TPR) repeat protein
MILPLLIASAVSAAPVPAPGADELLAGAEQAIQGGREQQAALMISRAIAAGAWGPQLNRAEGDLAYANGRYTEALSKYAGLFRTGYSDQRLLEAGGIAALKLGNTKRAAQFLERAAKSPEATWRVWNALGVIADDKGDWARADECFERALQLAPQEVGPVNNRGWSLLLRGEWKRAAAYFEKAVALDPKSTRAANNFELATSALTADLPRRQPGETEQSWAQRLNDAGVAAALSGDKPRAVAAFTQALDASGIWYKRAADNLEALGSR